MLKYLFENRPGVSFCEQCGASLSVIEPDETRCVKCGFVNLPGVKFSKNAALNFPKLNLQRIHVYPVAPESGEYRVIRGAGWESPGEKLRNSERGRVTPNWNQINIGFRCVVAQKSKTAVFRQMDNAKVLRKGKSPL